MRIDNKDYSPPEIIKLLARNPGSKIVKMHEATSLRNDLDEMELLVARATAMGITIKRDASGQPVAFIKPSNRRKKNVHR